ncbi:hypothetical protein HDU82_007212 [Entophlyctis luteolus]|nr:hypothetical protein HDU82_007212 [Entophlyctis luteolus]
MITAEDAVTALEPLGFAAADIRRVHAQTSGTSLEETANLLMLLTDASAPAESSLPNSRKFKLVLVVNSTLSMSAGKVAAQCSHAALGAVISSAASPSVIREWQEQGEPIVVVASGDQRFDEMQRKCKEERITTFLVCDAGRTEVASGSETVLAVGPADAVAVDRITGVLRLYK